MDDNQYHSIGTEHIPEQIKGKATDALAEVTCVTENEAVDCYHQVCSRLLNVNEWGAISSLPLSSFKLFDGEGRHCNRRAKEGDYIRIDIPGPGTKTGKGYDWVRIEAIIDESADLGEVLTMRVRPTTHPLEQEGEIAHFLQDGATSTFQVKKVGLTVYAEEHARNEQANLQTGKPLDNVRNAIIGTAASFGLSYPQWKSLVTGLVKNLK